MNEYLDYRKADIFRNRGRGYTYYLLKWFRKAQFRKNKVSRRFYSFLYRALSDFHGIEIPSSCRIGKGFAIFHPYNITINPNCVIGHNCDIHKGCLLGATNRGGAKALQQLGMMYGLAPMLLLWGIFKLATMS